MTAAELDMTESVCPYLGLPDDPRSHFTFPDHAHRCWAKKKVATIEPSYQASFCLGEAHNACDRFRKADRPLPPLARLISDAPLGAAPLGAAPLGAAPPGAAPFGAAPLGAAPPGAAPLGAAPLGAAPLPAAPLVVAPRSSLLRSSATTVGAISDTKPTAVPASPASRRQAAPRRSGRGRRVARPLIRLIVLLFALAILAAAVIGAILIFGRPSANPGIAAPASPSAPMAAVVTPQPSPAPDSPAATIDVTVPPSLAPTPSTSLATPSSSPVPSPTSLFPSPTPTPSIAPSPTPYLYTIQPGDTLISIANKFHVDVHLLQKVNHLKNPSLIIAGEQLIIPIDPSKYPDITPGPATPRPS